MTHAERLGHDRMINMAALADALLELAFRRTHTQGDAVEALKWAAAAGLSRQCNTRAAAEEAVGEILTMYDRLQAVRPD